MKCVLLSILIVCVLTNCASRNASQPGETSNARAQQNAPAVLVGNVTHATANVGGAGAKEPEREKIVPAEFRDVDFRNFTYPMGGLLGNVRLKDGLYEYENWEENSFYTLEFKDTYFADLTGDGRKEAIVRLNGIAAGVSSDGGAALFYFYSSRRNKPKLFWQLDTGSYAYECGLKSFVATRRKIVLELYRKCRFKGESFAREPVPGEEMGKYLAKALTRFVFAFDGRKFVQRERKVHPYDGRTLDSTEISISDD